MTYLSKAVEFGRILRTMKLGSADLELLRLRKLRAVISNAYQHVPYYRRLFRSAGVTPGDILTLADLRKIPVTTKDAIRHLPPSDIIADWADRSSLVATKTSGSTGKPFTVYRAPREEGPFELLNMAALLAVGFRPWDRLAFLGPERPFPVTALHRLELFSRRHQVLPTGSVEEQARRLREIQPTIFWVYPSALKAFIHAIKGPLRDVIRPRMIIYSAEVLEEPLKKRLAEELGAQVFNFYGAIEFGRIGWECKAHKGLHLNAGHFVFECLKQPAMDGFGEVGVATVTSLYAFAMPLIRYELGDLSWGLDKRCSCGSALPLIRPPIGRKNEMVVLPSGKMKSALHFYTLLLGFDGIDRFRVVQETPSRFVLQLVLRDKPRQATLDKIRESFLAYLEEPVTLEIRLVEFLEEEKRKFRYFVSNVDQAHEAKARERPSFLLDGNGSGC